MPSKRMINATDEIKAPVQSKLNFFPNDLSSDLRINSVGKLIFYLPSNLSVAQVKMVDALPMKFETEILVGLTGDVNADTRQKEFIKGISGNSTF